MWTSLRLEDPGSSDHRKAVDKLVRRLAAVGETVASRQVEAEQSYDADEELAGLGELLDDARRLLGEWAEAVEEDGLLTEKFIAVDRMLENRMAKVATGPASARYSILRKQVDEYRPLLQQQLETADVMLQRAVELRPVIRRATRIMAAHPGEEAALVEEFSKTLERTRAA